MTRPRSAVPSVSSISRAQKRMSTISPNSVFHVVPMSPSKHGEWCIPAAKKGPIGLAVGGNFVSTSGPTATQNREPSLTDGGGELLGKDRHGDDVDEFTNMS